MNPLTLNRVSSGFASRAARTQGGAGACPGLMDTTPLGYRIIERVLR
jgi:hypothetical protein